MSCYGLLMIDQLKAQVGDGSENLDLRSRLTSSNVKYLFEAVTPSQADAKSSPMALIESWMPPSREHWDLLLRIWHFYPLVSLPKVPLVIS